MGIFIGKKFIVNDSWAGSPLINHKGEIFGSLFVADAALPGTLSPGNMFVPINLLRPILKDLIKYGRPKSGMKPYLGISTNDSNGEIIVTRVSKDGPSDKAGIRKNDIIKSVNGKQVNNKNFYRTIWNSGKNRS